MRAFLLCSRQFDIRTVILRRGNGLRRRSAACGRPCRRAPYGNPSPPAEKSRGSSPDNIPGWALAAPESRSMICRKGPAADELGIKFVSTRPSFFILSGPRSYETPRALHTLIRTSAAGMRQFGPSHQCRISVLPELLQPVEHRINDKQRNLRLRPAEKQQRTQKVRFPISPSYKRSKNKIYRVKKDGLPRTIVPATYSLQSGTIRMSGPDAARCLSFPHICRYVTSVAVISVAPGITAFTTLFQLYINDEQQEVGNRQQEKERRIPNIRYFHLMS